MAQPDMEGLLSKQGHNLVKDWKSRYFTLVREALSYWKSKDDYEAKKAALGTIDFRTVSDVRLSKVNEVSGLSKKDLGVAFQVTCGSKDYYFVAGNKADAKAWMTALVRARRQFAGTKDVADTSVAATTVNPLLRSQTITASVSPVVMSSTVSTTPSVTTPTTATTASRRYSQSIADNVGSDALAISGTSPTTSPGTTEVKSTVAEPQPSVVESSPVVTEAVAVSEVVEAPVVTAPVVVDAVVTAPPPPVEESATETPVTVSSDVPAVVPEPVVESVAEPVLTEEEKRKIEFDKRRKEREERIQKEIERRKMEKLDETMRIRTKSQMVLVTDAPASPTVAAPSSPSLSDQISDLEKQKAELLSRLGSRDRGSPSFRPSTTSGGLTLPSRGSPIPSTESGSNPGTPTRPFTSAGLQLPPPSPVQESVAAETPVSSETPGREVGTMNSTVDTASTTSVTSTLSTAPTTTSTVSAATTTTTTTATSTTTTSAASTTSTNRNSISMAAGWASIAKQWVVPTTTATTTNVTSVTASADSSPVTASVVSTSTPSASESPIAKSVLSTTPPSQATITAEQPSQEEESVIAPLPSESTGKPMVVETIVAEEPVASPVNVPEPVEQPAIAEQQPVAVVTPTPTTPSPVKVEPAIVSKPIEPVVEDEPRVAADTGAGVGFSDPLEEMFPRTPTNFPPPPPRRPSSSDRLDQAAKETPKSVPSPALPAKPTHLRQGSTVSNTSSAPALPPRPSTTATSSPAVQSRPPTKSFNTGLNGLQRNRAHAQLLREVSASALNVSKGNRTPGEAKKLAGALGAALAHGLKTGSRSLWDAIKKTSNETVEDLALRVGLADFGPDVPKKLHDLLRPIVFLIAALHKGVLQIACALVASSASERGQYVAGALCAVPSNRAALAEALKPLYNQKITLRLGVRRTLLAAFHVSKTTCDDISAEEYSYNAHLHTTPQSAPVTSTGVFSNVLDSVKEPEPITAVRAAVQQVCSLMDAGSSGSDRIDQDLAVAVRGMLCSSLATVFGIGFLSAGKVLGTFHLWNFIEMHAKSSGSTSSLASVSMVRGIVNIKTNDMLTYSNDVAFRAFVCSGLNQGKLHDWIQLLCTDNDELLNKFYMVNSIVRNSALVQLITQILQPLSTFTFKLDVELEAQAKPQRGVSVLGSLSKSIAGVLR